MTRDRGYRKAQEERLYKRRKKYFRQNPDSHEFPRKRSTDNCADTIGRRKSEIINHPKKCSCEMCGNPRRKIYGNGEEGKTMPERKFNVKAKYEEGEVR